MNPILAVRKFLMKHLSAPRLFVLSFAALIIAGAVGLWLPLAAAKHHLSFVDALFTATSAVCVTGLTVVDIGKDLSLSGQLITLVLFQCGGLGIITFSIVLFGLMGRGISFRGREIFQSTFLHTPRQDFFVVGKWVLLLTAVIEAIGTAVLFVRFAWDYPWPRALYLALYHAVSAFNNCGYALFSDNLIGYQADVTVNLTIMALIVLGGMGFIVLYELISFLRGRQKRLSLHSRIVLLMTAILIAGGTILFFLFEMNHILYGRNAQTQLLVSLFQSITPRTCGFNTVDIGQLTNPTILLMIVLMFIGASPGSTGGGIKTTSFALLLLMIRGRLRGSEQVSIFSRTIPREILSRTIAIIVASAFSVFLITSVLLLLSSGENLTPLQSRHFFVEYLFETVSAFGTVGLSMDITAGMNDLQKLAIILMMFAGRVGPLTLAYAWQPRHTAEIIYAEEAVLVG